MYYKIKYKHYEVTLTFEASLSLKIRRDRGVIDPPFLGSVMDKGSTS